MSLKEKNIIFVLGGPGSGKGTQCQMIAKEYGYCHLSSGDLLRKEVSSGTDRGLKLQEIMKNGLLVPIDIIIGIIKDSLNHNTGALGFILDGFPREVAQASLFESTIAPSTVALYLNISTETMIERIRNRGKTSGRADDNNATVKRRLNTYNTLTLPVVTHFRESGKLFEVEECDAEKSPNEVFSVIRNHLDLLLKK